MKNNDLTSVINLSTISLKFLISLSANTRTIRSNKIKIWYNNCLRLLLKHQFLVIDLAIFAFR